MRHYFCVNYLLLFDFAVACIVVAMEIKWRKKYLMCVVWRQLNGDIIANNQITTEVTVIVQFLFSLQS